ncbi:MAG TPA: sigma factor-like helix-turn-helix DNA-binding protein [Actinomycetota bacterium]|nr:sigma factor-like helix-turn-helix DNA-binding protein [Actinomycetota bacterium]
MTPGQDLRTLLAAARRGRPQALERIVLAGDRPAGDVEEEAFASLGTRRALEELGRLTEDQRGVVLLRVVGDLSVEETARVLGKTPGALKALQRRALVALGRALEKEGAS